ncbi:MAG: VanZ family protein [Bacteroidota bacterium]
MVRLLTVGWMVMIFVLSTMPGKQLPRVDWLSSPDKWAHAFVYGVLTIGLYLSLTGRWQGLIGAGFIASLYGAGLEIVQYAFFPGRYFEVSDIVANISGAIVAGLIWNYNFNNS